MNVGLRRQRDICNIIAITVVFFVAQLKSHESNFEVPACSSYRREEQPENIYFCLVPESLSWFQAKTFCRQNKQELLSDIPAGHPLRILLHNKGIKSLWISRGIRKPTLPQRCPMLFLHKSKTNSQTVHLDSVHSVLCQEKHAVVCHLPQKKGRRLGKNITPVTSIEESEVPESTNTPVISIEESEVPESTNTPPSSGISQAHFSPKQASVPIQEHVFDWKISHGMPIVQYHFQSVPSVGDSSTVSDFQQNYLVGKTHLQSSQHHFLPYEVHQLFRRQAGRNINRANKAESRMPIHGSPGNRFEPDLGTGATVEKVHSANDDNVSSLGETQGGYPVRDPRINDSNDEKRTGHERNSFEVGHLFAHEKGHKHRTEHEPGEDRTETADERTNRFNETNLILSSGNASVGLGDSSEAKSRSDNELSLFPQRENKMSHNSNVLQYLEADEVSQTKTKADDVSQTKTKADDVSQTKTKADDVSQIKTKADDVSQIKTKAVPFQEHVFDWKISHGMPIIHYPRINDSNDEKRTGHERDSFEVGHPFAHEKGHKHHTEHEPGEDRTETADERTNRFNETNLILSSGNASVGLGDSSEAKSRSDNELSLFPQRENKISHNSNVLQYLKADEVSQTKTKAVPFQEHVFDQKISHGMPIIQYHLQSVPSKGDSSTVSDFQQNYLVGKTHPQLSQHNSLPYEVHQLFRRQADRNINRANKAEGRMPIPGSPGNRFEPDSGTSATVEKVHSANDDNMLSSGETQGGYPVRDFQSENEKRTGHERDSFEVGHLFAREKGHKHHIEHEPGEDRTETADERTNRFNETHFILSSGNASVGLGDSSEAKSRSDNELSLFPQRENNISHNSNVLQYLKADEVSQTKTKADGVSQTKTKADEVSQTKTKADGVSQTKTKADEVSQTKTKADDVNQTKTKADDVSQTKMKADEVSQTKMKADGVSQTKTKADEVSQTRTKADEVSQTKTKADEVSQIKTKADEVSQTKTKADEVSQTKTKADEVSQTKTKADEVSQTKTKYAQVGFTIRNENIFERTNGGSSLRTEQTSSSVSSSLSNDESYSPLDNEKDEHNNLDEEQELKLEEDTVRKKISEVTLDRKSDSVNLYRMKDARDEQKPETPNDANSNTSANFHLLRSPKFQKEPSNPTPSKSKPLSVGSKRIHQGTPLPPPGDRNSQTQKADINYWQEEIPNSNLSKSVDDRREFLQRNHDKMAAPKPSNGFVFNNHENDWRDDATVRSDASPNALSTLGAKHQGEQLESEFETLFDQWKSSVIDRQFDLMTHAKETISGESLTSPKSLMDSSRESLDVGSQFMSGRLTRKADKSEVESTDSLDVDTELKTIKQQNKSKNRGITFAIDEESSKNIQASEENNNTELGSGERFVTESDIEKRESDNNGQWHRQKVGWSADGKMDNNEELSFETDREFQDPPRIPSNDEYEKEFEQKRNEFASNEETSEVESPAIDNEDKRENRAGEKGDGDKPIMAEEDHLGKADSIEYNSSEVVNEGNSKEMLIDEHGDSLEEEVMHPDDRNATQSENNDEEDNDNELAADEISSEVYWLENNTRISPPYKNDNNMDDVDDRNSDLFNESKDSDDEENGEFRNDEEHDMADSEDDTDNRGDDKSEIKDTSAKDGDIRARTGSSDSFEDEDDDHPDEHSENHWHETPLEIPEEDETSEEVDISEEDEQPLNISILLNGTLTNIAAAKSDAMSTIGVHSIVDITDTLEDITLHSRMTPKTGQSIMAAIDNLLSAETDNFIESQKIAAAPNRILQVLERFGNNVDLRNDESILLNTSSFVVQVHDITQTDPLILGFASLVQHQSHLNDQPHVITLFNHTQIDDLMENMEAGIRLPPSLYSTHSAGNLNQTKNRLVFSYYQKTSCFDQITEVIGPIGQRRQKLNSHVISATWNGKAIGNLRENITTLFKPLTPHNGIEPATCVFWNFSRNKGRGAWVTEGCYYSGRIKGRYVCHCNHLTNFAVLMNVYDDFEATKHSRPLSIVSTIGLSLSCAGLVVTIVTFLIFRKFREGNAQKTLFQIAVAQLISWLVFLAGVEQTQNPFVCVSVAAILHYFILATFMWMLMEAVLQYHAFVKVFGTHISYFMLKASLIAWGVPLIPVTVVLSLDYKLYLGYSRFCWLTPKILYYAFGIPIGVILLFNVIVFILILKSITEHKKGLRSNQTSKKKAMINLQAAFTSFMMLGLSWIFGFLAIEEARVTFQYIFTILNTLQGFIIFLMFILRKQKIREWWIRLLLKSFKISTQDSSSCSSNHKSILRSRISSGSEISN